MLRKLVSAVVVLFLLSSISLAADVKGGKKAFKGNHAFGKVVSLDLKDGVGTLTVMARKARNEEPMEMKFKVTKDTKFMEGGGRGKEGTPVAADKVADTFGKDKFVMVAFEKQGDNTVAKVVRTIKFGRPKASK